MQQLGDITKIDGHKVPLVDVICGGSPCQDLSVAGKRAGLTGERSGLFMEQIRIIKEMRDESIKQLRLRGTNEYIRPRYMVWENVPGAFSSNKGEDFRAVLEKTAKVAKGDACIPEPPNGKWPPAGCIMGDGWSIAWRVHDAQFWGVPQRRKRIALVADFGGLTAPEILFEREGVYGNTSESGKEGEDVATDVRSGVEETGRAVVYGISAYESNAMKSGNPNSGIYEAETARTLDLNGGSPACNQGGMAVVSIESHPQDSRVKISEDGVAQTLSKQMGTGGGNVPMVMEPACIGNGQADQAGLHEVVGALNCMHDQQAVLCFQNTGHGWWNESDVGATIRTPCGGDAVKANLVAAVDCRNGAENESTNGTLQAKESGGTSLNLNNVVRHVFVVRRLTPLECERLQGFPDGWTDIGEWVDSKGKKHKDADSPRYKALGNSIALPFWEWMAKRMVDRLDADHPTMASLFDGIGGFPLAYNRAGCDPIWASEIEEFPIAVTKMRFPDKEVKE